MVEFMVGWVRQIRIAMDDRLAALELAHEEAKHVYAERQKHLANLPIVGDTGEYNRAALNFAECALAVEDAEQMLEWYRSR